MKRANGWGAKKKGKSPTSWGLSLIVSAKSVLTRSVLAKSVFVVSAKSVLTRSVLDESVLTKSMLAESVFVVSAATVSVN